MMCLSEFDKIVETYNRVAIDNSFLHDHSSSIAEDGVSTDLSHREFISRLLCIEKLVCDVLDSCEFGYEFIELQPGRSNLRRLPLSKYFLDINDLLEIYSPEYEYSSSVDLFFRCCSILDIGSEYLVKPLRYTTRGVRQFELFNDLIRCIRVEALSSVYRDSVYRQREKQERRMRSARKLVSDMLEKRSRFDVIRIDLSYQYEAANNITLQQAKSDLARLFSNRRHKPRLFEKYLGGLWKLEWAPLKGYHFHLLLFFKDIEKDAYLAQGIIKYWNASITKGKGIGFNCNAKKNEYQRLGIGRIERTDELKLKILIEDVIYYLAKTDQCLRAKKVGGEKVFMPCPGPKRGVGGRPRVQLT